MYKAFHRARSRRTSKNGNPSKRFFTVTWIGRINNGAF